MRTPRRLAALAATTAVLAACTSHGATHATAPVRSALSGGARTCTDPAAACGRSGAVRWVLPLTGTYRVDRPDDSSDRSLTPVVHDEDGDGLSVVASDDTVYLQTGERVLAVDIATGTVKWRHVTPGTTSRAGLGLADGRLLYIQRLPGEDAEQYLSLDPHTGTGRTIPLHVDESPVGHRGPGLVLLRGIGLLSDAARAGVRHVDPVTGRTRWHVRLHSGWDYEVHGDVLYADDYGPQPGGPKAGKRRYQTRSIQRVDLRTGERLPDVRVPKRYWGGYYLDYVTHGGVIVVSTPPASGSRKHAFTMSGRPVTPVPKPDKEPDAKPADREVDLTGRFGGVRHLSGHGWTGPAMRAPAFDTNVLVGSGTRVAVSVACGPDGVRAGTLEDPFPGTYCTKPRFFGVTW